jgi:hypothetical protein
LRIDPYFTSKLAISTLLRNVVRIVDNFSISHDALYHGCLLGSLYLLGPGLDLASAAEPPPSRVATSWWGYSWGYF